MSIKKGQVFVRAITKEGRWGTVDVLDLDNESFRAFVVGILFRAGAVCGIKDEVLKNEHIVLKERTDG